MGREDCSQVWEILGIEVGGRRMTAPTPAPLRTQGLSWRQTELKEESYRNSNISGFNVVFILPPGEDVF